MERKQEPGFNDYIFSVKDSTTIENVRPAAGFALVNGSGYVALSSFLNLADNFFRSKNLIIDTILNIQQINPLAESFKVEGVSASKMVFCEGAHIRNNPLFQWIKMVPVKGEILLIHAPSLSEEFILNKKVFVLPVGKQRFKVGSTYEWTDLTDIPTEKGKISIVERLENVIGSPYEVEKQWAGIRPATIDRRPVLGAHSEFKNIFVFNGLGTKGVMLAPYFAREMVSLLSTKNFVVHPEVNSVRFLNSNEGA